VQGFDQSDFGLEKIALTNDELVSERETVSDMLN